MSAPYGGPSHQLYPQPQPQSPQVQVPETAGDGWLAMAALTDGLLALLVSFGVAQSAFPSSDNVAAYLAAFIGCVFAFSFANHVLDTLLFRGSLGKLLWGLRVVRWKDSRRPRFWQTFGRWLFGFVIIALQYLLEGESVGQACGLRTVRRRELRNVTMG